VILRPSFVILEDVAFVSLATGIMPVDAISNVPGQLDLLKWKQESEVNLGERGQQQVDITGADECWVSMSESCELRSRRHASAETGDRPSHEPKLSKSMVDD
jgi:hypothetical protein